MGPHSLPHGECAFFFFLLLFLNNYYFTFRKKPSCSFEAHVIQHHPDSTTACSSNSPTSGPSSTFSTPSLSFTLGNFYIHNNGPDWTGYSLTSSPPMPFTTSLLVTHTIWIDLSTCHPTNYSSPLNLTGSFLYHHFLHLHFLIPFVPFFFPVLISLSQAISPSQLHIVFHTAWTI